MGWKRQMKSSTTIASYQNSIIIASKAAIPNVQIGYSSLMSSIDDNIKKDSPMYKVSVNTEF